MDTAREFGRCSPATLLEAQTERSSAQFSFRDGMPSMHGTSLSFAPAGEVLSRSVDGKIFVRMSATSIAVPVQAQEQRARHARGQARTRIVIVKPPHNCRAID